MQLLCLESSDRFHFRAGKTYNAPYNEIEKDGLDKWVWVENDNRRKVRVNFKRFEEIVSCDSIATKLEEFTNDFSPAKISKLSKAIDDAIGWLKEYRSGTDDECEAWKAADALKKALGFTVESEE